MSNQKYVAPFSLAPLPYAYDALEPVISAETMRLHHDKHHQAYIDALNKAVESYPEGYGKTIEELLGRQDQIPEAIRTTVRNQGGGHANHQFFWKIMKPGGGGEPDGELADAIKRDFGSFDQFQQAFQTAGAAHFGSGWVFLVTDPKQGGKLEILTLPNQDSVLPLGKPGLLASDLWEHAYYLQYQNRRADYLKAWWNVVAWDVVSFRLKAIRAQRPDVLGGPFPRIRFED